MKSNPIDSLAKIRLNHLIIILLFSPFLYSLVQNYLLPFRALLSFNLETRSNFSNLGTTKTAKIIKSLQDVANLPISQKKKTLLFIPQSNQLYWGLKQKCDTIPFIAPAITGMAMLDGLPAVNCKAKNYGYRLYQLRKKTQSSLDKTKKVLCKQARERGFFRVIIIDIDPKLNIVQSNLSCS